MPKKNETENKEKKATTKKTTVNKKPESKKKTTTKSVDKKKKVTNKVEEKKIDTEKEIIDDATVVTKENTLKETKRNAAFIERLGAFIIDFFIISMIVSLVTYPFATSSNTEKLNRETEKVIEQYQKGKIDANTYLSRASDISYDLSKETGLSSVISVIIFALYFIVFQYKNGGQTIGKKLLKIKISKSDGTELNINDVMFRALIIDFILYNIITLCITLFASKDVYFYGILIFEFIQYIVIFISAIMILSRKDKRGLHDVITHTEVIKENIIIEEVEGAEA